MDSIYPRYHSNHLLNFSFPAPYSLSILLSLPVLFDFSPSLHISADCIYSPITFFSLRGISCQIPVHLLHVVDPLLKTPDVYHFLFRSSFFPLTIIYPGWLIIHPSFLNTGSCIIKISAPHTHSFSYAIIIAIYALPQF